MSGVGTSFVQADRYEYPQAAPAGSASAVEAAASRQAPGVRVAQRGDAAIVNTGIVNTGTQRDAAVDGLDASSSELAARISGKTELYTKDFDMGMTSVEARGLVRDFFGDLPYRKYQPRPALPVINIDEMRTAMADSQVEPYVRPAQPAVAAGDQITPAPTAIAQAPTRSTIPAAPAPETTAASAVVSVTPAPLPPLAQPAKAISG